MLLLILTVLFCLIERYDMVGKLMEKSTEIHKNLAKTVITIVQ